MVVVVAVYSHQIAMSRPAVAIGFGSDSDSGSGCYSIHQTKKVFAEVATCL